MALIGYETERQKIQAKIDEIKARLGGRRGPATAVTVPAAVPTETLESPDERRCPEENSSCPKETVGRVSEEAEGGLVHILHRAPAMRRSDILSKWQK